MEKDLVKRKRNSVKKIRKAIFPVAGLGTRFLPATKAMPKEMLPIVDKPLIQYAVEEAVAAGIEEFIFVTGRGKSAIEDHFDHSYELESLLGQRGKAKELEALTEATIMKPGSISYTRQQEPLGLGHAVWCARHYIQNEPFAVLLADDFIFGEPSCLREMVDAYHTNPGNLVAAMDVPEEHVHRYGILKTSDHSDAIVVKAEGVVEKPSSSEAPSHTAVIGRYILQPEIFSYLDQQTKGAGGEIQLTDSIASMLDTTPLYGVRFQGTRYDCGSKAGFLAANLAVGLTRSDIYKDLATVAENLLEQSKSYKKVS